MSNGPKIGELNGKWSILLRAFLAVNAVLIPIGIPLAITFAVWVTTNIFEARSYRAEGTRFTAMDGMILRADLLDAIKKLPRPEFNEEWKARVTIIERYQQNMLLQLARIEAGIANRHGVEK